jgi:lipopolysaccharide export system protein LptA
MKRHQMLAILAALPALTLACAAQSGIPVAEPVRLVNAPEGEPATGRPGAPSLPGARTEKRAKGPTEITAREANFDNRTHEAGFTGAVLVKDPEFSLSCERLAVYLKKPSEKLPSELERKEPAGGGIEKAIAEIDVVITQDKVDANGKKQRYVGRAKKAIFDNTTGDVTLSGWPQISHSEGGSITKQITSREEGCIIIINRAGRIDVRGYHTTTLQDTGALEEQPR